MSAIAAENFDDPEWLQQPTGKLNLADLQVLAGGEMSLFNYTPPGPVAERWMTTIKPVHFLMGPWGSGKTTTGPFKCVHTTLRFPPCKDEVIRVRGLVLRDNLRELSRTTLETWLKFFPKDFPQSHFEGGQDRPFKHTLRFRTPRGQAVEMVVIGLGIGAASIEGVLKGFEPSWAWLEEVDLMARKVPGWTFGRLGRFPSRDTLKDPAAKMPRTVFGTLNPPLITHWFYEDFVEKPIDGYVLERQPSGLSDNAENKFGHPRENYEAMAKTMKKDDVRRFVKAEFGMQGDGSLVYPDFDYDVHVRDDLDPVDVPLRLGLDAKGTPAAALFQYTANGKLRVIDEVVGDPNCSAGRFGEMLVDLLQARYRGLPVSHAWGDPSGFYGADRVAGELAFLEVVAKTIGVPVLPTHDNNPQARQESVDWFIRRPPLGGDPVPFFLIGKKRCPKLLAGFQGGFLIHLNNHETSSAIAFVKNKHSHPHEALQYGAYGSRGHAAVMNDAARAGRPGNVIPMARPVQVQTDFNVP